VSGKGSAPRPYSVDEQTYSDNWARTFGDPREKAPPADPCTGTCLRDRCDCANAE
jgi:hypothetical protein